MINFLDKTGLAYFWGKVKAALNTKANSADLATVATSGSYDDLADKPTIPSAWQAVEVEDTGAVTQAIDAHKVYYFTGELSSLAITLNASSDNTAEYVFEFDSGKPATAVYLPTSVRLPVDQTFEAATHYRVSIMNNYATVWAWSISDMFGPYNYSIPSWGPTTLDGNINAELNYWNHFASTITADKTSVQGTIGIFDGTYVAGNGVGSSSEYMVIPAGSSVTLKLVNISNPNSMPIEVYVSKANETTKISSLSIARFTNAADKTVTATLSDATSIGNIWIGLVRTGRLAGNTFSCDVEFYVNDERWI